MSKLKLPLPYISHSSFALFHFDPLEWYQQYYVARVDKQTDPMTLGKIFQLAWSDPKFDYAKALKKEGFTSDKARIIKQALNNPEVIRLPKKLTEKEIVVQGRGLTYPILAQLDGEDQISHLIVENKFGMVWKQERLDTGEYWLADGPRKGLCRDRQKTWYMLAFYLKYRKKPKFLLQSFNGKNGQLTKLWGHSTMYDFELLINDINNMVTRIEAGDFEKH